MASHVIAIDQGTTGTTVLVLDRHGRVKGRAYSEITQYYPKPGWVEHDPEEIWTKTLRTMRAALTKASITPLAITAIGITNQRETTVIWEKKTGKPIHRAIVWQCRRTAPMCEKLRADGTEAMIQKKTGLVLDAYFSGSKVNWLLNNVRSARTKANNGDLAFGTIDTWLIWKLTGGEAHVTDYTNASRTLLYNIRSKKWDPELLKLFDVPATMLPEVHASSEIIGYTVPGILGKARIPIAGIAGDQQAALFGQMCTHGGLAKNTYGTGCFVLVPTGKKFIHSKAGLITTLSCDASGKPQYCMEGSVFIAGAAIQWLRDEVKLLKNAADSERIAKTVADTGGVYLVPAFVGLGAPYWDMDARGALLGITRGTSSAHIVRATLESIAYQSADLIDAMESDTGTKIKQLRVDGGATANNLLMQFQADILGIPVERPKMVETTALGAAFLAGLATGVWDSLDDLSHVRKIDRVFTPKMKPSRRKELRAGWNSAIKKVLTA